MPYLPKGWLFPLHRRESVFQTPSERGSGIVSRLRKLSRTKKQLLSLRGKRSPPVPAFDVKLKIARNRLFGGKKAIPECFQHQMPLRKYCDYDRTMTSLSFVFCFLLSSLPIEGVFFPLPRQSRTQSATIFKRRKKKKNQLIFTDTWYLFTSSIAFINRGEMTANSATQSEIKCTQTLEPLTPCLPLSKYRTKRATAEDNFKPLLFTTFFQESSARLSEGLQTTVTVWNRP